MRILLSTGAFTGRVNGRDHRLALEYANAFPIDGFEWMIFDTWYEELDHIARSYARAKLKCPVVHTDKQIGNLLSDPAPEARDRAMALWEINCRAAAEVHAEKLVTHIWGLPHSTRYFDCIADRCAELVERAAAYGLEMVPENTACADGSPLSQLRALSARYPDMRFTIDTRPAQFSAELIETCESDLMAEGKVGHVHINDYAGGRLEWEKLYPILQPGQGDVDFDLFFRALEAAGFDSSITLEAPSMQKEGVDVQTLTAGIEFIRERMPGNR